MIGGGVVERRDNRVFVKQAIATYLEDLSTKFHELCFVAPLSRLSQQYSAVLDTTRIDIVSWNSASAFSWLTAAARLLRSVDRHSVVLLYLPQPHLLPLVPLLRARAARLVVYVAGDWVELAAEVRRRGLWWRAPLERLAVTLPLRLCDTALVRGAKLAAQAARYAEQVLLSEPVIDYRQAWSHRADSCIGRQIRLLYVGKVRRSKGVGILLQGISYLRLNRPELFQRIVADVVGAGDEELQLRAECESLGLREQVRFHGFVDETPRLSSFYAAADILIVPSVESEGLPRVIDEGLRHQLPIIASAIGGIRRTYQHGRDVFLVPPGSPDELGRAITRIIDDAGLRRSLIAGGARLAGGIGRTAAEQHAEVLIGASLMHLASTD